MFINASLVDVNGCPRSLPAATSTSAKSPTRVSPFTVHFWVSQFGWQLWFMNLAWFPFGPASMMRSYRKNI